MVNISNNGIISMNRGDTVEVPLFINVNDKLLPIRYPFSAEDEIYLGISEPNQRWECALIKKKFTAEDLNEQEDVVLKLSSEDTEFVLPGTYYYEVKLRHVEEVETESEEGEVETIFKETVYTIVPKRKFIILE